MRKTVVIGLVAALAAVSYLGLMRPAPARPVGREK